MSCETSNVLDSHTNFTETGLHQKTLPQNNAGKNILLTEELIHGKPVYWVRTRPFFDQSGFVHKRLCDGYTFTAGTACAYSCTYCYVEGQTLKHKAVNAVLARSKKPFSAIVIRRANALRNLALALTRRRTKADVGTDYPCEQWIGKEATKDLKLERRIALYKGESFKEQVIFASAFVDVAATEALARETVEMCDLVLKLTDFQIRLLSKSPTRLSPWSWLSGIRK